MKETLLLLLELQELENSLRGLKEVQTQLTVVKTENASSIELFERMLKENAGQLEEIQAFCKTTQAEIEKAADDARRARQRMSSITSQKELNALNKEIETARRNNQNNTEELKKLQGQYDEANAAYEKRVADFEALKTEMTTIEENMVSDIAQRLEQSSAQTTRREEIHGQLDRPMVSRFNRIMASRGGVAIAEVNNEVCGGCRMRVPPQQFNRVLTMSTLEACQQCSRIMVYRDNFAQDQSDAV